MIGERLRSERERLGMTQPEFAELADTKKRTLIDWEKGVSSPTAVQLAAMAKAGADVLYILTGQRAGGLPAMSQSMSMESISEADRALLDNFHAAPEQVQAGVKTTLGAFAPGAGTGRKRVSKAA